MKQTEHRKTPGTGRRRLWYTGIAAVLALALAAGILGTQTGSSRPRKAFACSSVQYPQTVPYPNEEQYVTSSGDIRDAYYDVYDAWWKERRARMELPEGISPVSQDFYTKSIRQLLSQAQGKNRVYSPLNLYFALGMLTEITGGNSRQQILELLGTDDRDALRAQVHALWNISYCNDGASASILANSLWLNQDISFHSAALDQLSRSYYASSYQGEMGSPAFNHALQNWLNEQTGGLLEEEAAGIELDSETVIALASTLYFRSKWGSEFSKNLTEEGTFHAVQGDTACPFMRQSGTRDYYWGEQFSAVGCSLESGGSMWFLLPDEGVSIDELLDDSQAMSFLLSDGQWDNRECLTVHLSIPKFDISSDLDLLDALLALGITDILDDTLSDFSPLCSDSEGLYLSRADHAARVAIDEEGCLAAAYTVMAACGTGAPPAEEIDFVLDRPFLFAVTGTTGELMFVGVVNQPNNQCKMSVIQ